MKTIKELVEQYQKHHLNKTTNVQRVETIKCLIENYGIENVAKATGYKLSTLITATSGQKYNVVLSEDKVKQAEYVFEQLNKG